MNRLEQAFMAITVASNLFMGLAFMGIDPVAAVPFAVASMAFTLVVANNE